MKAAILHALGTPLAIETVPDPTAGPGEVVVEVIAAPVLSYTNEVFDGTRTYHLIFPMTPGCGAVGRVHAIGPDATRLAPGAWVFCDPTVRARDEALAPDIMLQGWTAPTEGARPLQQWMRDGAFSERMRVPMECVYPLGDIAPTDASRWCASVVMLVPYGGWLAGGLQAGETALVNTGTGNFGSAAIAVALAMGAGTVLATGRDEAALADLVRRFGPRVRPVRLSGDVEADTARMKAVAEVPIDRVLDILPLLPDAAPVRSAAMSVRANGSVALMGGLGVDVALPCRWLMRNNITIRGQWMYPRDAVPRFIALLRSGLLPLDHVDVTEFPLAGINEAIAHAAAHAGAFRLTVLRP
jgi:alcohol dehydrogenase